MINSTLQTSITKPAPVDQNRGEDAAAKLNHQSSTVNNPKVFTCSGLQVQFRTLYLFDICF